MNFLLRLLRRNRPKPVPAARGPRFVIRTKARVPLYLRNEARRIWSTRVIDAVTYPDSTSAWDVAAGLPKPWQLTVEEIPCP